MDYSTPGTSVFHYLPEFAQTHIHWVNFAIQLSNPMPPPSPFAFNLSQHQFFPMNWFFTSGGQVLELQLQHPVLPMSIQGWFPLGLTGLISLLSKGLSRVFSSTTIWKCQFFSAQSSLWSNSHIHTWLQEITIALIRWTLATHSSVLAWRIPGMGEPGGMPSMGSHRVRHDWSDLAAAADRPLSAKWCLCFLICCLGFSSLFFQERCIF